jgi:hypothetical protein
MLQKTVFKLMPPDALGGSSDYAGFQFGCAQEPKNGEIRLVQGYHSCREGLVSSMRGRINEGADNQPTDKMRMIFRWTAGRGASKKDLQDIESWVHRSIAILRALDKLAGWPLTRVYKIEHGKGDWLQPHYFLSSRRWMKSSYLVSLYCLLVRMGKDERIDGFKDFKGLCKVVDKALASGKNLKNDHTYVKTCRPYWEAIMRGYSRMFEQYKLPYYWDSSKVGGRAGVEGINYLVTGDTAYTEMYRELKKIRKELEDGSFSPERKKKSKK